MSMTPGQILWEGACCEMGFDPREWSELNHLDQKRIEAGAQAVREDLIATLAGLVKESLGRIYDTPGGIFFSSLDWKQRAQNVLSRLVDAPDAKTPTVDTPNPVEAPTGLSEAQRDIAHECDTVRNMLLDKNRKYGNSALDPVRVFSKADSVEQIKVRIDDKLSRLASLQADDDEDVVLDLIGYLILLRVAQRGGSV